MSQCSGDGFETKVQLMYEGSATLEAVALAVEDAKHQMKVVYGIDDEDDSYAVGLRYLACHILYMWGLNQRVTQKSVGDISLTRKDLELGDKEGESPYLFEFKKLYPLDLFNTSV